jgi:hypothetical protein
VLTFAVTSALIDIFDYISPQAAFDFTPSQGKLELRKRTTDPQTAHTLF